MKKIQKSKKGFTLVEMVLVIAIIVILAAVLVLGIGAYLTKAKAAAKNIICPRFSWQYACQRDCRKRCCGC